MNYKDDAWIINTIAESALKQGFVILDIDFRGSPQDVSSINPLIAPHKLKRVNGKWKLQLSIRPEAY